MEENYQTSHKSCTIRTPKGERTIGTDQPTFIIAEMSSNHNQDFDTAVAIIKAAAQAGADAIKLQTYTADTMTINCNKPWFKVGGGDNPESWLEETLYSIYQKAYTPWEWHQQLQKIAEDLGLVFFSTPFDSSAVDFLEKLNVPLYKISSYEVTDIPLLKKIAETGKPIIMSVGFASKEEIEFALHILRENGSKDIIVLHCVTAYSDNPRPEETNLKTMIDIKNRFDVIVGFSDNNAGTDIPLQAVMMGASVVEKHVIAKKDDQTFDTIFSVGPIEFKSFVDAVRRAESVVGKVNYGVQSKSEEHNSKYRRSLFVVNDIKSGEIITTNNVHIIRPSFGLAPKYYGEVLGKKAKQDIEIGTPLQWEMIE